jgi:hypothetical protein
MTTQWMEPLLRMKRPTSFEHRTHRGAERCCRPIDIAVDIQGVLRQSHVLLVSIALRHLRSL